MDEQAGGDGQELLRRFAAGGEEAAFREVVEQLGGMVHGVALRKTGDREAAEEVAQRVFIALARKARRVARSASVGAWLHRAAVLESLKVMREKRTTQARLAMIREQLDCGGEQSPEWGESLAHLDEAFDRLKDSEREVLMLHYVEGRTFREVGERLRVSDEAARKRAARALERLAGMLRRRGVAVPVALVSAGLTAEYAKAAPAGLARSVASTAARTAAGAANTSAASAWQSLLTTMKACKLSVTAAVLVGAAIPVGIEAARGSAGVDERESARKHQEARGEAKPKPPPRVQAEPRLAAQTRDRLRAGFERLEEGEEMDDELELALRRLVYTLDGEELAEARRLLDGVEKVDRFREIAQAVYARWAELDAESAIASASRELGRFGYYPLHGAFGTWTVTAPEAALEWLVAAETPFDLRFMGYEWLRRTVKHDPESAVAVLEGLAAGKPEWSETMHWALADAWAKRSPGEALEWVKQFEGEQRQMLLAHLVKAAGEGNPPFALRAAEQIENREGRLEAIWEVVWWWSLDHPDEVIHFARSQGGFGTLEFGALEPETLRAIGEGLARNRPAQAAALGERIESARRRDSYWSGVLRGVTEADAAHFAQAAEEISDEFVEREASGDFMMFVRSWFERDPEAARAWAEQLPEGPKRRLAEMAAQLGAPLRAAQ